MVGLPDGVFVPTGSTCILGEFAQNGNKYQRHLIYGSSVATIGGKFTTRAVAVDFEEGSEHVVIPSLLHGKITTRKVPGRTPEGGPGFAVEVEASELGAVQVAYMCFVQLKL